MADRTDNEEMLLAELREADRDRYLAALLSPAGKRGALAALYLFSAELARVRERVSEPLPGEVRLQYWRDLLEGSGHGSTEANPSAAALLQTIDRFRLPLDPLIRMTEARIFDLYDDPMGTISDFEGYAGETASALIQLASLVLDADAARRFANAAGHAGVAQAVAGTLLLLPRHRAAGRCSSRLKFSRPPVWSGRASLLGTTRRESATRSGLSLHSGDLICRSSGPMGRLPNRFCRRSCQCQPVRAFL
nr:phytoene/squalene synthase family protein [Marinicella sp. W31]MDC2877496.1 phytoene/squalene synthase family protein [Marinicella sp. W31]